MEQFLDDEVCEWLLLVCFTVVEQMPFNFFMELISGELHTRKLQQLLSGVSLNG